MTLNISLNPAAEARLRSLAEQAGTDVNVYVSQLIEVATEEACDGLNGLRRPLGLAKGTFQIPPSFFDPLPDDVLEAFEGIGR